MCWQRDHTGSTRLDRLRDLIDCYGWAVQGAQRERIHPASACTAGLTLTGGPDVVVTGNLLTLASAADTVRCPGLAGRRPLACSA